MYECGGVFLIDEIDNGNPSILSVLNTALANGQCAFPDRHVLQHPDNVIVAAANTIGRGADVRYIGRNALDATTLDRFVFLRMDIDENLESAIAGAEWQSELLIDHTIGDTYTHVEWCRYVQTVRWAAGKLGLEHIISPRATIYGMRLTDVGVTKEHVEQLCLWKGLRETDRIKLKQYIERYGSKRGDPIFEADGVEHL
jgi:hypothetical protein